MEKTPTKKPKGSHLFKPGNTIGLTGGRPEEWTKEKIDIETQALEDWINDPTKFYLNGFATDRGYHSKHLEVFAQRHEGFRLTLARAREVQEQRIVEASLTKKFDGNFAKFVLANRAGWKERTEVSGDSSNPLALVLDKVAKQNQPEPIEAQIVEPESITNQSAAQSTDNQPTE